ncbi:uncharacterized protein LOC117176654 [Belonocnema kinseyi]|uniref:uncharacterized protein LOC117176654 n=1 Tax=Belonocnema kinseyi TaxID=2817044 RepID=UPI00143D124C|nr:uncharacterized protein LOC117176654 [Belonocnema kinseyi]
MDFKCNSVIALYLAGKSQPAIVSRYNNTGNIAKRHGGGHKNTETSREMVQKVKKRLERNPRGIANQMTKELKIFDRSIRRIPNIVFSDEKIFPIEQFLNSESDRVYLTDRSYENLSHRLATRRQHQQQIMVWAAVTADGCSPIVFIESGIKMTRGKTIMESPIPNSHQVKRCGINVFLEGSSIMLEDRQLFPLEVESLENPGKAYV